MSGAEDVATGPARVGDEMGGSMPVAAHLNLDPACSVEGCDGRASWKVYAAYPVNDEATHPTLARYPMPFVQLCGDCLHGVLSVDQVSPTRTAGYYVMGMR